MKTKRVSGLLFFSLLTLVVCNDVKAMDDDTVPDRARGIVKASTFNALRQNLITAQSSLDAHIKSNPDKSEDIGRCSEELTKCQKGSAQLQLENENYQQEIQDLTSAKAILTEKKQYLTD